MPQQFAAVGFGLLSALIWGAGDFCGGLGTRRASVLGVLTFAELSGLVVLLILGIIFGEPLPALPAIGWAFAAGIMGNVGLGFLYRGLATGRASIVAPVSAVIGAGIPVLFTVFTSGLPDIFKLIGFAIAFLAIVLASQSEDAKTGHSALQYGLVAGVGFGGFFILIDQAGGESSTFYPLVVARAMAAFTIAILALIRRVPMPAKTVLPIILLSGVLDAFGNVFFLLASTLGTLDVATILSSLYPASTVILSRFILHEKTTRLQQAGVVLALIAIVLIAL
jgi:drug/metabolite transporter (DMT)-like permease